MTPNQEILERVRSTKRFIAPVINELELVSLTKLTVEDLLSITGGKNFHVVKQDGKTFLRWF